ncbi:digestive cysteine proteinase 2-like [Ostrinia furnacalis]|uniref:digestive cysteine proteinase 2-like n=1 Tax=Ostrinia furnacalis TaxID=93504 RepID=UPI001039BC29|nr:digestive cysteine proteinase 2-like [Ostrinia furnacalis]
MWLPHILFLSVLLTVHGKCVVKEDDNADIPELEWPANYTFEATRVYLLAGFSEQYQMWRTPKCSRIDYNDGAFKSIITTKNSKYGVKYEIFPKTDKDANTEIVCHKIKGTVYVRQTLEDILPNIRYRDFKKVGNELMYDQDTTKFWYQDDDTNVEYQYIIWAFYKTDIKAWVPVRYEEKEYNTWLGTLDKHEIWEFRNFNTDEIKYDVFDAEEDCEEEGIYSMDDEAVTEGLLFLDPENNDHVEHAFQAFKKKHNKNYFEGEHEMRKTIFRKNMRLVSHTNRKNLGYKLAINQFADRTEAEMVKHKGLQARPKGKVGTVPFPYTEAELEELAQNLPKEYDTRMYGLVTPVKNQESCGSCWTFGTTASMEGAVARSTGKLVTLSNQALVDCAWAFGAAGCDGGTDNAAYEWMMSFGLPTEAEYGQYTNTDGFCHIENMTTTFPIRGFTDVSPYSINALKVAVINHGPLSVSVNANDAFSLYSSGIFYDASCSPSVLNHEVTLVGYGEENGQTFWILKNSWGRKWGVDGYMQISTLDNTCGVTAEPTYVVI